MSRPRPQHLRAPRRWRFPGTPVAASLVILAGTLLVLYPHVASWFSQLEQSRVTTQAQQAMQSPPNDDATFRHEQLARARAYNDALASGARYDANTNIATGAGESSDETLVYADLLNVVGDGFMGRLMYDALEIDLPIYHGTADHTLEMGVGHLEGTSLPVGGLDTRSVLTAHRGLPEATLFNELNRAAVGDTFRISVLGEVLSYVVTDIAEILPTETQAILPESDRDLVTLVTCTPLGVNSHRILVTGERITPTPAEDVDAAEEAPVLPHFPWWIVILGLVVLALVVYVWRAGYAPRPSAARTPAAGASEAPR